MSPAFLDARHGLPANEGLGLDAVVYFGHLRNQLLQGCVSLRATLNCDVKLGKPNMISTCWSTLEKALPTTDRIGTNVGGSEYERHYVPRIVS